MEQWNSLEIDNKIKRVIKELGLYEEKKYYYLNDFFRVRLIEEISRLNGISLQKYRGKKIITIAEELINEYKYSSFSDYSNGERKKLYRIIKLIFGNENIDKFFIKDENYKNRNIYKVTKELTIFYNFMLEIATISYIRIIRNASEIENNNDVNEERVAEITHRASEIIRMIHPEEDTSFLRECNENVIFKMTQKNMWKQFHYIEVLLKKYEKVAKSSDVGIRAVNKFYKDIVLDLQYCAERIDMKGNILFEDSSDQLYIIGSDKDIAYFSEYRNRLLKQK